MILTPEDVKANITQAIATIQQTTQPNLVGIIGILEPFVSHNLEEPVPELYQKIVDYHHTLQTQDPTSAPNAAGATQYLTSLLKEDNLIVVPCPLPPVDTQKLAHELSRYTIPDPRFPPK